MVKRVARRRPLRKRRMIRRRRVISRPTRGIATNTAAVRENYTVSVSDGLTTYYSESLANLQFDRAQMVARAFQEYRIKYIKLTFRPSADTFPIGSGPIPQLYCMVNKAASIPLAGTLQTLLDMGAKPIRFDDKNIVRAWKPTVLIGADQVPPASQLEAAMIKVTPWLSTNIFAQNPGAAWQPSNVQHYGLVFFVTKPSPTTPTIAFNVDCEVVFQFRKPLAEVNDTGENNNVLIQNGQVVPVVPPAQNA